MAQTEKRQTLWKRSLLWFGVCLALVFISYWWIDRPLSFFAHRNLREYPVFDLMTLLPHWFPPVAICIIALCGLQSLIKRPLPQFGKVAFLCSLSFIVARAAEDQLKFVFGRNWPETWVNDNPSLIRDDAYGFHPFHGGVGFASFPSGHTTAICAVVSVLWFYFPRWRFVYCGLVLMVATGLIGANYHFLSDVISGGFLGTIVGLLFVSVSENTSLSGQGFSGGALDVGKRQEFVGAAHAIKNHKAKKRA